MERPWVTSPSYELAVSLIVDARHASGLSQRALAEKLCKPRSYVSKIETRERRLDFVEFIELARALGVEPSALIDEIATKVFKV